MNDKIIIVTGGYGNLGKSMVDFFREQGATVIVFDIIGNHKENDYYQVDLMNVEETEKAIDTVLDKYGRIDVLINNAGLIFSQPLINFFSKEMRHNLEAFDKCIKSNLYTTFIAGSIVIESMIKKRVKGVIINMSSIAANGNIGQTAYSASKSGIEGMTKTWAKELGPMGIRCVAVAPGFINTSSTKEAINESTVKHVISNTPLKKLGEVSSILLTIKYIIENTFLTGTVIEVDGGLKI